MTQGQSTSTGRDWVLITWEGNVLCPWHGELTPTQGYEAGAAACGCDFQQLPGGLLVAVRDSLALPVLQTDGENAE